MEKFRKMTMGEVAEVAGEPKETIRARINRGVAPAQRAPGWARFDVPSTVQIAVHAELMRRTEGNHQIALQTADFAAESLANSLNGPRKTIARTGHLKGHYLLFRRHDSGLWSRFWADGERNAARLIGEYLAETVEREAGGFYVANVGTFADWALDRIFDLQGITGEEAQ